MPFMGEDEFILLFDAPNRAGAYLSVDDLCSLVQAGIRTALLTNLEMDDFQTIENHLTRYAKAGMKCLLPLWARHSTKRNQDWYARDIHGSIPWNSAGMREYLLSPWNMDAQAWANNLLKKCRDIYNSNMVQIVSPIFRDGEMVMPNEALCYDFAAIASWHKTVNNVMLPDPVMPEAREWIKTAYTRMIVEQQRILVDTPGREIWMMLHLPKQGRINCGVDFIADYYQAFRDLYPNRINHITFSYFPFPQVEKQLTKLSRAYDTAEWVGAEYCEGLQAGNAAKALEHGRRGLILGPCHYFTGHFKIELWMLKEIERAMELFERVKV